MATPTFFINTSNIIGQIIVAETNNTTGSPFLTLFLVIISLAVLGMMFRFPTEIIIILLLPLGLTIMAFEGTFYPVVGVMLLFLSFMFAKQLLFNR